MPLAKALVGIRDAAVMLFFVFVLFGIRSGVAAQPEVLDELLPLLVGLELLEGFAFFVGDDLDDVFVQPLLIRRLKLFAKLLFVLFLFALRHGT